MDDNGDGWQWMTTEMDGSNKQIQQWMAMEMMMDKKTAINDNRDG